MELEDLDAVSKHLVQIPCAKNVMYETITNKVIIIRTHAVYMHYCLIMSNSGLLSCCTFTLFGFSFPSFIIINTLTLVLFLKKTNTTPSLVKHAI